MNQQIDDAADRLQSAAATLTPCAPVRDLIGSTDVDAAYAVQRVLTGRRLDRGRHIVGRKIGLTSPAVQQQLGVDRPDFGVLFDDMRCSEADEVPVHRLMQPKAEAEIAFVLATDLSDGDLSIERVRAAVEYAVAAIEIVDSRITDWDITFADTVADNASSGMFVLGSKQVSLDEFEPVEVEMSMTLDDTVVSTGTGAACLGDPLVALTWLATTSAALGDPLRAGQVILSGALGPMAAVGPGARVRAELSHLGTVSITFSNGAPA